MISSDSGTIMDGLNWQQPFIWLADLMRPHNKAIALAMVTTLLVIFGDVINGAFRKLLRKQAVWIRVTAFIGLCAFGYGAFIVWITPVLASFLMHRNSIAYVFIIIVSFIVVGVLAERFQRKKL